TLLLVPTVAALKRVTPVSTLLVPRPALLGTRSLVPRAAAVPALVTAAKGQLVWPEPAPPPLALTVTRPRPLAGERVMLAPARSCRRGWGSRWERLAVSH